MSKQYKTSYALYLQRWRNTIAFVIAVFGCSLESVAREYQIPTDSNVVGHVETVVASHEDTIYTLAVQHEVGASALINANNDIDHRLPGEGVVLSLPTRYVLPNVEREGIIINLPEMRLYYFPPHKRSVHVYPVGIGRQGWDTPLIESRITSIVKDPTWTPPQSIHQEYQNAGLSLPAVVPPGRDNPLGEYALRIGHTSYLIHGTNNAKGVGLRVSHGCIRLYAAHIEELASMIDVNTPVKVINQPLKIGRHGENWVVQVHKPIQGAAYDYRLAVQKFFSYVEAILSKSELMRVKQRILQSMQKEDLYTGLPIIVKP